MFCILHRTFTVLAERYGLSNLGFPCLFSYRENAQRISAQMRDRARTPTEEVT